MAANGFSLDVGGHVVIGDDGTVYVTGQIYVDFETTDVVLLSYTGDGLGPDWELLPQTGGTGHVYTPDALALDGAGSLVFGFSNQASMLGAFWIDKYEIASGDLLWTLTNEDIALDDEPTNWQFFNLDAGGGRVIVAGTWANEEYPLGPRQETYIAQLDGDGSPLCFAGMGFDRWLGQFTGP